MSKLSLCTLFTCLLFSGIASAKTGGATVTISTPTSSKAWQCHVDTNVFGTWQHAGVSFKEGANFTLKPSSDVVKGTWNTAGQAMQLSLLCNNSGETPSRLNSINIYVSSMLPIKCNAMFMDGYQCTLTGAIEKDNPNNKLTVIIQKTGK